jgi:hypothetical protein
MAPSLLTASITLLCTGAEPAFEIWSSKTEIK